MGGQHKKTGPARSPKDAPARCCGGYPRCVVVHLATPVKRRAPKLRSYTYATGVPAVSKAAAVSLNGAAAGLNGPARRFSRIKGRLSGAARPAQRRYDACVLCSTPHKPYTGLYSQSEGKRRRKLHWTQEPASLWPPFLQRRAPVALLLVRRLPAGPAQGALRFRRGR